MDAEAKRIPMYQTIANDIQQKILSSNFDYENPICTERSICEQYGVSRITAKHAITKLEDKGILYRKRGLGSFVVRHDHMPQRVFALIIPFSTTQGGIFKAIRATNRILSKKGYHFTINMSHADPAQDAKLLNQLYSQNVSGIVYYPRTSELPLESLHKFIESNHPVVVLDKTIQHPEFASVVCDNYKGGYLLTEHIISYGHTKTCYLSRFATKDMPSLSDRYSGYRDCLISAGITGEPRFVHWSDYSGNAGQSGYYMLQHIVNNLHNEGTTAIICENDEVAFNVYMCCINLGLRIPEDINIAGFDNIDWATTGNAQITTVDQNFDLIGEATAAALLVNSKPPQHKVIPVQIIPRTSTGPLNKK